VTIEILDLISEIEKNQRTKIEDLKIRGSKSKY